MDTIIASMFQAFTLSMQLEQSNDYKEALATKALWAIVKKVEKFDQRNISKYLRCYVQKMELNQIFEKKMIELFDLAIILEIREYVM